MIGFILRRLLQAIPVLFGVSVLVFMMLHLIPGDPAELIAGHQATAEDVEDVEDMEDVIIIHYIIMNEH